MAEEDEQSLEYTSTWRLAIVCLVLVIISLGIANGIHHLGKILKKNGLKALLESLEKMKEELMLLGFISLFLTIFQEPINHICIPKSAAKSMLPCNKNTEEHPGIERLSLEVGSYARKLLSRVTSTRRLLSNTGVAIGHCEKKGMEPFLSIESIHQLDIFVFLLAIVHMVFCVSTMLLARAKLYTWRSWELKILKGSDKENENIVPKRKYIHVKHNRFIKKHLGTWGESTIASWMVSFFKQFYLSVTESDYRTMRLGFIKTHIGEARNAKDYNFYKYMVRTLEDDFKKVVGIRWYLWIFVVIFFLLNIHGWHIYFWISFIPLILLLALGAKLEHVTIQLAQEVKDKHTALEGDELFIYPSNDHFWFSRPQLVLSLIHFILFQNAFDLVFFFWILTTYGFKSCLMGKVGFVVPRLVIGVIVQVLCSYSTLPLYAFITQMGGTFKKTIFTESVHEGLVQWAGKSRMRAKIKSGDKPKDNSGRDTRMKEIDDTSQTQS